MCRTHRTPTKRRANFDEAMELAYASVGREASKSDDWDEDRGCCGGSDISRCDCEHERVEHDRDEFRYRWNESVESESDSDERVSGVDGDGRATERVGTEQPVGDAVENAVSDNASAEDVTGENGGSGVVRSPWCTLCNAMSRLDCLCDLPAKSCGSCSLCAFCSLEGGESRAFRLCHGYTCSDHLLALVERYYSDGERPGSGTNASRTEAEPTVEQFGSNAVSSSTQTTGASDTVGTWEVDVQLSRALRRFEGKIVVLHADNFQIIFIPTWAGLRKCVAEEMRIAVKQGWVRRTYTLFRFIWKLMRWERKEVRL